MNLLYRMLNCPKLLFPWPAVQAVPKPEPSKTRPKPYLRVERGERLF